MTESDHDEKDDHDDDDGDVDHVELRLKDRAKVFPIISMIMIVKIMGILGMTNKMICLNSKRIFPEQPARGNVQRVFSEN